MADNNTGPTDDEIQNALLPGSEFWQWDAAKQSAFMERLKSRSEHPDIVEMQRQLLDLLKRAALETPAVRALIEAARDALEEVEGTVFYVPLRDALDALGAFDEPTAEAKPAR